MISRWIVFTASLVVGGSLGFLTSQKNGLALGLVFGAYLWLIVDSIFVERLLRWLRIEQANETPVVMADLVPNMPGVWGEATNRIRRLLNNRDRQCQDSQARLDEFLAAMQASPSGVVLLDAQGRIEWCNQMATQHFGFDAQRDVLQYISNLVREPAFKAYMEQGNFLHDVLVAGRLSSPARPVKLSVHVHAYGKNRKLLLSRDITAVELAEAMRRDFVANVSHEIRTPLTVLSGFIETLQTLQLKQLERTRYLALMAEQSQRMQALVTDLLTLSRLDGSSSPHVNAWITVSALFAQCEKEAKALSVLMSTKSHQLKFEMGLPCEISGVQTELYSALSNLVINAVRYTPAAGQIHVNWSVLEDGRGQFEVTDTGPGIAPEHLPRLTERFYRIDRSRSRETGGTGLGLAIVKHVAQRHGAELYITSVLGHGSCFAIIFPAIRIRELISI